MKEIRDLGADIFGVSTVSCDDVAHNTNQGICAGSEFVMKFPRGRTVFSNLGFLEPAQDALQINYIPDGNVASGDADQNQHHSGASDEVIYLFKVHILFLCLSGFENLKCPLSGLS